MVQPTVREVRIIPQANVRTIKTIPAEVQEELLAFVILRNQLCRIHAAVATRESGIVEKLIGAKLDAALVADLAAAHNRRAARMR